MSKLLKKLIAVSLVGAAMFAVASCGGVNNPTTTTPAPTTTSVPTTTTTQAPATTTTAPVTTTTQVQKYTVSFNANGGSGTMADATEVLGEYPLPACTFTAPQGKEFKAWEVNGQEKQPGDKINVSGNVTVKALWKDLPPQTFTVTFNANGGSDTMADATEVLGEYTLPACTFTAPQGKEFKAWEVNGQEKQPGDKINVSGNVTVKALWQDVTPQTFTVTFNANGGSGTMADATEVLGEYTLPECGFTAPADKEFNGWDIEGTIKQPGEKINVTSNVTLNASWKRKEVTPVTSDFSQTASFDNIEGVAGQDSSGNTKYYINSNTKIGDITLVATADKKMEISANSKEYTNYQGNNVTSEKAISTGGKSDSARHIEIDLSAYTGKAKIQIFASHTSSSGTARNLWLTTSAAVPEGVTPLLSVTTSSTVSKGEVEVNCGSKYYVVTDSGIRIFAINIIKVASSEGGEGGETTTTASGFGEAQGLTLNTWAELYTKASTENKLGSPDEKNRVKTTAELTLGNYTFPSGVMFVTNSTFNTQGKTITIVVTDNATLHFEGTSGSSADSGKVVLLKGDEVVYESEVIAAKGTISVAITNLTAGTYKLTTPKQGEGVTGGISVNATALYYVIESGTPTPSEKFTVSFDANGGSGTMAAVEKAGEYALPTCTFTAPQGKEFKAWEVNGEEKQAGAKINVTANVTVKALWQTAEIPSTIASGFGSAQGLKLNTWADLYNQASSESKLGTADEKGRIKTTDELVFGNYTFPTGVMFPSNSTFNTQGKGITIVVTGSATLYFVGTSGSSGDTGKVVLLKGDEVVFESEAIAPKGTVNVTITNLTAGTYTLTTPKQGEGVTGGISVVTTSLYYTVEVEKVSVTFVKNNGENNEIKELVKGAKVEAISPSLAGKKFVGWFTEEALTNQFDFNTEINESISLYAKYEDLTPDEKATISFNSNGALENPQAIEVEKGKTFSNLPTVTKEGFRFAGWFSDEALATEFTAKTVVNADVTLYAKWVELVSVTFMDKEGNELQTLPVDKGSKLSQEVTAPKEAGFKFKGWKINNTETVVDLTTYTFTQDIDLIAVYEEVQVSGDQIKFTAEVGSYESAYVTFAKVASADGYNVYLDDQANPLTEKDYYVQVNNNVVRIDVFGLKAEKHDIKVVPTVEGTEAETLANTAEDIVVEAYDRSGYAHFNYTEGVGAYKDDGTLKANAIVLYVTDENKNTVELTYGNITVKGIGNILNSVGAACGDAGHETECKKVSNGNVTYGKGNTNQNILLKLAQDNIPLVVRFIGCVSNSGLRQAGTFNANSTGLIQGLTAYDSADYGGSTGDNGHMARMKSAKNITFEGVGSDAVIDGWGFHLICETAYPELAKNFEVRNLAFINTPEDAIGMEGQETESTLTITASVERCWVHHNTFIAPKISSPAESDKGEGDGSCDFKRGRYFTCSYNYFEECHKTNLVGSSKTSVQYNLSYHHNIWYNCASRQPLARHANIHFYNNLIIGTTDTVSSLRADTYLFAENNYYMGCSRPFEYKAEGSAGVAKAFGNILVGCFNANEATYVSSREEQISAHCIDNGTNTDYSHFDTDPNLFYYDAQNKKSNCYLTSAAEARIECLAKSGSAYRTVAGRAKLGTSSNVTDVASSATVSGADSLTIAKGKGILKVFTVTSPVTITVAASASAGFANGYLLKMNGELVLELAASDKTAQLLPGEYVFVSGISFTGNNGKNNKETTITKCVFEPYDSEELNQQLIANYNAAVEAIPATIVYTNACYSAIKNAQDTYNSLGELKSRVDYSPVNTALQTYKNLGKAHVEGLIDEIVSPVTEANSDKVLAARSAYDAFINKVKDVTISNANKLIAAEEELSSIAVNVFLAKVQALPQNITINDESKVAEAETAYNSLTDEQKTDADVKAAHNALVAARDTIDSLKEIAEVQDLINDANDLASYEAAYDAYKLLSADEKASITGFVTCLVEYVKALINAIPSEVTATAAGQVQKARAIYDELDAEAKELITNYSILTEAEEAISQIGANTLRWSYDGQYDSLEVTKAGSKKDETLTAGDTTFTSALKLDSKGSVTFTITSAKKLTIYASNGTKVKIGETKYTYSELVGFELQAGTYTISKGDGETWLFAIILE